MGSKNTFLVLPVCVFLSLFHSPGCSAQQGSLYFSAGYNQSWFGSSTIHIEQNDLGNSYNMVNVKGDNKTGTPISATSLCYRLGYFFNEVQTHGIELSFDPINYEVTQGQNVRIRGILNNTFDINKTVPFTRATGAYYEFTGANFVMLSMVKRLRIYMANTKKIAIDAIGKVGAGPALPHFASSLPINPVDDPGLNFAGWNAGVEAGVRVRGYRFIYIDLTAKYDYSSFNSLIVYDGTARQNLTTYSVIASIGITVPTHRLNPLFFREPNIVTILPFYQNKDHVSKTIPKRKIKYDVEGNEDTTGNVALDSIPEFQEILDRKYKKEHPDTVKATWYVDSLGRPIGKDSISAQPAPDTSEEHLTRKQLKRKHKAEEKARREHEKELEQKAKDGVTDTTGAPAGGSAPPADAKQPDAKAPDVKAPDVKAPDQPKSDTTAKPEEKAAPEELSKKERKRKEKEERRLQKEKEKEEAQKAREAQDAKEATPPPPDTPPSPADTTGKGH